MSAYEVIDLIVLVLSLAAGAIAVGLAISMANRRVRHKHRFVEAGRAAEVLVEWMQSRHDRLDPEWPIWALREPKDLTRSATSSDSVTPDVDESTTDLGTERLTVYVEPAESEQLVFRMLGTAEVHWRYGELESALRNLEEARGVIEPLPEGTSDVLGALWQGVGDMHRAAGRHREAVAAYQLAVEHKDSANDVRGVTTSLQRLGVEMQALRLLQATPEGPATEETHGVGDIEQFSSSPGAWAELRIVRLLIILVPFLLMTFTMVFGFVAALFQNSEAVRFATYAIPVQMVLVIVTYFVYFPDPWLRLLALLLRGMGRRVSASKR